MKAAQISEYGHPDKVKIAEVAKPTVGEGKILVEVHAASLNPFDTVIREGHYQKMIPLQLPVTLGGDIAGVVSEVGPGVTDFKVGDKVYGQASAVAGNSGAFAEYAVTAAGQIAAMPGNVDFTAAATLPLVGVSAVQALTEHIKLAAGQKLLIQGGAGAIGSVAIQLAKHLGAHVAATATGPGIELAKRLGADEVIDYKTRDFTEFLSGYDAVFDTAGGEVFGKSLSILKTGGVAVSMIAAVDAASAKTKGVTVLTQATNVNTVALNRLRKLVEDGVVTIRIDKVFPLEQTQRAFEAREARGTLGQIVLEIK